jgi:hypothetical protein
MKLMSSGFSMGTVFSSMRDLLRFDALPRMLRRMLIRING